MAVWPTLRNFGRLGLTTISRRGAASEASKPTRTHKEIVDYVERETKNRWRWHGFDPFDKKVDAYEFHVFCFCVAGMFVFPIFMFRYKRKTPDRDWIRREAFLVLAEREAAGLVPVDVNYVDPAKLELPTDEELDGAEVII